MYEHGAGHGVPLRLPDELGGSDFLGMSLIKGAHATQQPFRNRLSPTASSVGGALRCEYAQLGLICSQSALCVIINKLRIRVVQTF